MTPTAVPIPRRPSQSSKSRVSISSLTQTPSPTSRSHPLLGSYPLSLIHSRMSHAHAPHSSSTEFSIYIKAIGKSCTPELRCPRPLDLGFAATYYDLEDTGGPSQTPWVGTVELEEWYHDQYSSDLAGTEEEPPIHPGYRIAPVGQLQMIVKTPTNAIKAFLVPYDLRSIPIGGRLLARERTYIHNPEITPNPDSYGSPDKDIKGKKRESLRYAYQLQFTCLPLDPSRRASSTTRQTSTSQENKAYYLSKSLRIVFTSTPPESDQETRTERTNEIVPASDIKLSGSGRRRSSVGMQPVRILEDWNIVRQKWLARRKLGDQDESALEDDPDLSIEEEVLPPIRSPSRTGTPIPQPFNLPHVPTAKQAPPSPIFQRRPLRRTSAEERELSEKLRKMALE